MTEELTKAVIEENWGAVDASQLPLDRHLLKDGRVLRVLGGWNVIERRPLVIVNKDGDHVSPGGIIMPNYHREDATAVGIVRAIGGLWKGDKKYPVDLERGHWCCFLWFYAETHTNELIQRALGDDLVLLKWEDIALTWPADENHFVSDMKSMSA